MRIRGRDRKRRGAVRKFSSTSIWASALLALSLTTCTEPIVERADASGLAENPRPTPSSLAGVLLPKIRERGVLQAGIILSRPPFGFQSETGPHIAAGFEVDLAASIADALGVEMIVVDPLTESQRLAAVENGEVYLLVSGFTRDSPGARRLDLSIPYLTVTARMLIRSTAPVITGEVSRSLCTVMGTTTQRRLRREMPNVELVRSESLAECMSSIAGGYHDGALVEEALGGVLAEANPEFALVGPPVKASAWRMAIAKGNPDFMEFVNTLLVRMQRNGELRELARIWGLGPYPSTNTESERPG